MDIGVCTSCQSMVLVAFASQEQFQPAGLSKLKGSYDLLRPAQTMRRLNSNLGR